MNKYLIAVLALAIIPLIWFGNTHTYGQSTEKQDIASLLITEKDAFSEAPTVIVSYFGYLRKHAPADQLMNQGAALSEQLGLPAGSVEVQQNTYPAYVVQAQDSDSITVSMKLGIAPGHSEAALSLTLQSSDPADSDAMSALKARMDRLLSEMTTGGAWTTVTQGSIAAGTEDVIRELSNKLKLKESERYQDTGTLSITYRSGIEPNSPHTSVQVALHRNSETGQTRLTIGTPAIHVEY